MRPKTQRPKNGLLKLASLLAIVAVAAFAAFPRFEREVSLRIKEKVGELWTGPFEVEGVRGGLGRSLSLDGVHLLPGPLGDTEIHVVRAELRFDRSVLQRGDPRLETLTLVGVTGRLDLRTPTDSGPTDLFAGGGTAVAAADVPRTTRILGGTIEVFLPGLDVPLVIRNIRATLRRDVRMGVRVELLTGQTVLGPVRIASIGGKDAAYRVRWMKPDFSRWRNALARDFRLGEISLILPLSNGGVPEPSRGVLELVDLEGAPTSESFAMLATILKSAEPALPDDLRPKTLRLRDGVLRFPGTPTGDATHLQGALHEAADGTIEIEFRGSLAGNPFRLKLRRRRDEGEGQLDLRAFDPRTWFDGEARSVWPEALREASWEDVAVKLAWDDESCRIVEGRARLGDRRLTFDGEGECAGDWPLALKLSWPGPPVLLLRRLFPDGKGIGQLVAIERVQGRIEGALAVPDSFRLTELDAFRPELRLGTVGKERLSDLASRMKKPEDLIPRRIDLPGMRRLRVYDGRLILEKEVTGSSKIVLDGLGLELKRGDDGFLRLEHFEAGGLEGYLSAKMEKGSDPQVLLTARIEASSLTTLFGDALESLPMALKISAGSITAKVRARLADGLGDPEFSDLRAEGVGLELTLEALGRPFLLKVDDLDGRIEKTSDGRFLIHDAMGRWLGGRLNLTGSIRVEGSGSADLSVDFESVDLALLEKSLPPSWRRGLSGRSGRGSFRLVVSAGKQPEILDFRLAGGRLVWPTDASGRRLILRDVGVRGSFTSGTVRVDSLTGRLFGGALRAQGDLGLTQDAPWALDLNLVEMDLRRLSEEGGFQLPVDGFASAFCRVTRDAGVGTPPEGAGWIATRKARIWGLPVFQDVAKALGVQADREDRLESLRCRFRVDYGRFQFYELQAVGKPVNLYGHGSMDLDGERLDIGFVPRLGGGLLKDILIVGEPAQFLFDIAKGALFEVHLRGRLADPRVEVKPLPVLTAPFEFLAMILSGGGAR